MHAINMLAFCFALHFAQMRSLILEPIDDVQIFIA